MKVLAIQEFISFNIASDPCAQVLLLTMLIVKPWLVELNIIGQPVANVKSTVMSHAWN